MNSWGPLPRFRWSSKGYNYFHDNINILFALKKTTTTVVPFALMVHSHVDKSISTFAWIKTVASNYTEDHCLLHQLWTQRKKKADSRKHFLDEAIKIVFTEHHFNFGIFSKINEVRLSKNWQHLLPLIKFKLLSKN